MQFIDYLTTGVASKESNHYQTNVISRPCGNSLIQDLA